MGRNRKNPQLEHIKKILIKKHIKPKKHNFLLYLEKGKRSITNVTYDSLVSNGKITEAGWGFLRELAIHIRLRFYPNYKEKEDLTLDLMLKGATQILDYKGDFNIKNWRNYIFSGMRNTASNANYYRNKDKIKILDVDEEDFKKYYEKYLIKTRDNEIEEKEESDETSFYNNLKTITKRIFNNKQKEVLNMYKTEAEELENMLNTIINKNTDEEEKYDTNFIKEIEKTKKRLDVLVRWK